MSDTKDVKVYFTTGAYYGTTRIELGKISSADVERIMETFASASPQDNACIKSQDLNYTDDICFEHFNSLQPSLSRTKTLQVSNHWWLQQTPLQCIGPIPKNTSQKEFIKICAHNLRTGKCRDALIRSTLGVALFPHLYSKDKQK